MLSKQAERLAEASSSLDAWHISAFGSWIKVSSANTLSELNRHWRLYSSSQDISSENKARLRKAFLALASDEKFKVNLSAARSAGPLWFDAVTPCSDLFARYWKTGALLAKDAPPHLTECINPTFAYSLAGEGLEPHYGTLPVQAFHLGGVLAQANEGMNADVAILKNTQDQFEAWGETFRSLHRSDPGAITMRLHSGDALAFGNALFYLAITGDTAPPYYTAPWQVSSIDLSEHTSQNAPLSFNVIDTSNLVDHLGLLNVLIVCRPLMSSTPDKPSVLYTETLLRPGKHTAESFVDRVCADIPLMATLIGLAPRAFMAGFTSISNIHEIFISAASTEHGKVQYHERVAWVEPTSGDCLSGRTSLAVSFPRQELSSAIFSIYNHMFAYEDVLSVMKKMDFSQVRTLSNDEYHRGTFAAFLRLVKGRVLVKDSDWDLTIDDFLGLVESSSKQMIGMNSYQDLCAQLHLHGVYTVPPLDEGWRSVIPPSPKPSVFNDWLDIPPMVCVALIVPAESFGILCKDASQVGTPTLQLVLSSTLGHYNIFSAPHALPGRLVSASSSPTRPCIESDPGGWQNASSFLFTCWIPSWLFMHEASTTLGLIIRSTPASMSFMTELGLELVLFRSNISDVRYVQILKERPGITSERMKHSSMTATAKMPHSTTVSASLSNGSAILANLIAKMNIVKPTAVSSLQDGAAVSPSQSSSCGIDVTIGSQTQTAIFPYPVDGKHTKLRVARKSKYIEVRY